jgi:hypothetical protein
MISLGMLLLAIAVFSWGLKYKLSLYDLPTNPSTHMAEAKLLSNKERPSLSNVTELAVALVAQPILTVAFAYLIGAMLVGLDPFGSRRAQKDVRHSARVPKQPNQSFFFFRPPPAVLPSF